MRAGESMTESELGLSARPAVIHPSPIAGRLRRGPDKPCAEMISSSASEAATPWWLWWNLLSLDAPTVALIWAVVFARVAGIGLRAASALALVLAVFLIYVVDRLLDGWADANGAAWQERHRFCARHRRMLLASAGLAALGIVVLAASWMPIRETKAGVALASVVALYILAIQLWRGLAAQLPSKEWAVGILFAAGTTLPVWSRAGKLDVPTWLLIFLFALLCALNCVSIDFWEGDKERAMPPGGGGIFAAQRMNQRGLTALAIILGLGATLFSGSVRAHSAQVQGFIGIAVGAFLLAVLNQQRSRWSRSALRVLADAALVVAGLLVIFLRG
jgi:hypothetical protein